MEIADEISKYIRSRTGIIDIRAGVPVQDCTNVTNLIELDWPHWKLWEKTRFRIWARKSGLCEDVEQRWLHSLLQHHLTDCGHEHLDLLEVPELISFGRASISHAHMDSEI